MSKREGILAVLLVMCATGWALQYHTSFSSEDMNALRRAIVEQGSPLLLPAGMTADFDHLCVEVRKTPDLKAPSNEPTADQSAMSDSKDTTP